MTTTILYPEWIVPVVPRNQSLKHHALVITGERIEAILPAAEARTRYPDAEHRELPGHVLMPGFVNLHGHSAMTLLRGLADDLALMDWLQNHIWPAEAKHVSDEFVFDGCQLAMLEMFRSGTTTINDMYFEHEAVARSAIKAHMRTAVGCSILEFPTPYAANAGAYIERAIEARNAFKGESLVQFTLAPHAPFTVADDTFCRVVELAEQWDCRIHCHIHETMDEVNGGLKDHGVRPLARLEKLGMLSPRLIAAHMVHLNEEEIALTRQYGVHVAHNATSNLKLASGIAPITAYRQAGINVGIGTDGAASNNKLDMFAETRLAGLLPKVQSQHPESIPAWEALEMATLGGATALGLANKIGSLEAGKFADVVAIKLDELETTPCYDPISHLVYAAGREQVQHVWVAGRQVLDSRQPKTLDQGQIIDKARWWGDRIRGS
ncbi:TRZ/ATZ family hydrolase [Burkholderiaceae bacterium DAT-1]|nr:TRZ/ATZ family hydrolase [Burkholderiaceae bacterium DAT-1]